MFRVSRVWGFAIVLHFAAAAQIQAASIPLLLNTTTGTTIYDDNFEAGTVGSLPVASVGSYYSSVPPTSSIQVVSGVHDGLAAYQGNQYLDIDRPATGGGLTIYGQGDPASSGAGNTIQLQIAFRLGGPQNATWAGFYPLTGANRLGEILLRPGGRVFADGVEITGTQSYVVNAWNTLNLTHINGTTSYGLSINGALPTTVALAGLGNLNGIEMSPQNNPTTLYVDAIGSSVPEPTTAILAPGALIGLLLAGTRKRINASAIG